MLIPKEKHQCHRIVKLVHDIKILDLVQVAQVYDGEVLDAVGDLVEHFVHGHAVGVGVTTEADYHEALFFGEDCLVHVPAGAEMREGDGSHFCGSGVFSLVDED
jgi:hypothetical protein